MPCLCLSMGSQQTHQHWINVETTLIVNVHQRCSNVDIWLKMKVEPTYIYRSCFNVSKTTLLGLRRFNVYKLTLFQLWNSVENESWADLCLPMLFQCWQNNVETKLKELRWFNVGDPIVLTLVFGWKSNLSQRMLIRVASTLRKHH